MMRRVIATILVFLLLFAAASAEVVNVNFPKALGAGVNEANIEFEDEWFLKNSNKYDHNIARISLGMAVAAFRSEVITYTNSDANIRSFFEQMSFENYEVEQYDMIPTKDTIASAIAMRRLPDGSTLVAVAISGQGYKNEWMSNFAVGGDEIHVGFRQAAKTVYERLQNYIQKYVPAGRIRIWTAGFSRAAATANLLAAHVINGDLVADNDVFAYTFGTPSTSKAAEPYPQIFNICNSFDPVPFIPFANWKFSKFGKTLYLPAREVDPKYGEKLESAKQAFIEITGSADGFASNVNANWLLSKIMELLYQLIPQSTFYSEAYQQIFIDTYATAGSATDKLGYLVSTLTENEELRRSMIENSAGAGTLLAESIYNVYMEISGKRSGRWADLFTGASQLVHEHEPSVYLAWLMSTDDPDQLYKHPTNYTRLIFSGNFGARVENADGEEVPISSLAVFTLNNQIYIAFPDEGYTVYLTARSDTKGALALRYHSIRSISDNLSMVDEMHFSKDEMVRIELKKGGKYSVSTGEVELPLIAHAGEGLRTIAGELTIGGSNGIAEIAGLAKSAVAVVIPHAVSMVLLLIYCFFMFLYRITFRHKNEVVETKKLGRWLLTGIAVLALFSVGRHLFFCLQQLSKGAPDLENRTALRAAEIMGIGTMIFELTDILMYSLLAVLAWRGRRRHRSRIRGRRLAGLLFFIKLIQLIGSYFTATITLYDIGCVAFFLMSFVAFIIVRDGAYEKAMRQLQKEQNRKQIEERRAARARKKQ